MAREDTYGLRHRDFKPDTCFTISRLRVNSQGYLREADEIRQSLADRAPGSLHRDIYATPKEKLQRPSDEVEIRARDLKAAKEMVREFFPRARFSKGGSCPRRKG